MRSLLKAAAAVVAAGVLAVSAAPQAQAMSGDQIYNCGVGAGETGYTGQCTTAGYSITYKTPDGFQHVVSPGHWSLNNVYSFYVDSCFKARNLATGYDYKPGWHVFSAPNAKLTLQLYYQGWC